MAYAYFGYLASTHRRAFERVTKQRRIEEDRQGIGANWEWLALEFEKNGFLLVEQSAVHFQIIEA